MKLEITNIAGASAPKDKETLVVSAIARHVGEIEISITRHELISLIDGAALNRVITLEDLECVLSRIERAGRTFHKQSSK